MITRSRSDRAIAATAKPSRSSTRNLGGNLSRSLTGKFAGKFTERLTETLTNKLFGNPSSGSLNNSKSLDKLVDNSVERLEKRTKSKQNLLIKAMHSLAEGLNGLVRKPAIKSYTRQSVRTLPASAFSRFFCYRTTGKRLFDILFSLSVLILFSPLYLLLALAIYLNSPGSVLYIQRRVGRQGRSFGCMKFRTMVVGADEMLAQILDNCPETKAEFEDCFKLKDDPRITRIGKWLRMTSLDEFPQFWNVLVGDMTIVGPRPLVKDELPKYGEAIAEVLTIRPGITGLWQVSGRNDIPYDRRIQIDLRYVRRHSLWMDIWIVFKTIGVVIFPKGNGAY